MLAKITSMNDSRCNADGDGEHPRPQGFETTCWSVVLSARDGGSNEAREALSALFETYWYPLYAFVRRKGHNPDTAQDVVQGFFTRLLERGGLASVTREKGKFRSFLMAACTHFMANEADHDRAKKRGGGVSPISIDRVAAEGRYACQPTHKLTAERLFERQWALALLDSVLRALTAEMTRDGKARQFEILRPTLLGGAVRIPYAQIAADLGLPSEEAARAAAHRLRKRYRVLLCEEVARTVDDPADVDAEIRSLFGALVD